MTCGPIKSENNEIEAGLDFLYSTSMSPEAATWRERVREAITKELARSRAEPKEKPISLDEVVGAIRDLRDEVRLFRLGVRE